MLCLTNGPTKASSLLLPPSLNTRLPLSNGSGTTYPRLPPRFNPCPSSGRYHRVVLSYSRWRALEVPKKAFGIPTKIPLWAVFMRWGEGPRLHRRFLSTHPVDSVPPHELGLDGLSFWLVYPLLAFLNKGCTTFCRYISCASREQQDSMRQTSEPTR
jgi:hypothetical protein